MSDAKYRKQARENIPVKYYPLATGERLRADDLIWSWTSGEWLRADDERWTGKPLTIVFEEMICAIRPVESQFTRRRSFVLKK